MKVIHLILGKANPERMNGVNKVVHALATEQHRAGWDVEVWGISADVTENYPPREFRTRLFPASRSPFRLPATLAEALTAVAASAVVHLHGGFIPVYYSVAHKLQSLGVPYIVTPHGSYSLQAMRKSRVTKQLYLRLCEQYVLRHAAWVHCLGQSEVQGVRQLHSADLPTRLLPYGFELPAAGPPAVAAPGQPQPPFRVGFCGRLDESHKGLSCLIAGFGEFARQQPAAELWIIGDGPDRARVEQWAAAVPAGTVKVLGSRFGEEKFDLLRQLDAFAHTSHYEGLPVAILEAASLGIPCVVTEATNMGAYIRQFACGQVLAQAEPAQFAASLHQQHQQCLRTPRPQLRQRCRDMVRTAFAWPTLLREYQHMYQQALHA